MNSQVSEVDVKSELAQGSLLNRKVRRRLAKQRGDALLNFGIVMILVAAAAAAAYFFYSKSQTENDANVLGQELALLMANSRSYYSGNFANISNSALSQGGFFKKMMSLIDNSGTVSVRPGNGTLVVAPGKVTVNNDSAQYTITNLPDGACLPLINGVGRSAAVVTVNSNSVKAPGTPLQPNNIKCDGDANTIVLVG